ncbi:hypothetical protein EYF80_030625 [Liparis tanakae]|uniref:Uncharacterized protein n=1 Tax=Liparis tanakae TaxID=230148 RepID=A0A4Z2H1G2_9TELE|nr:hypothetical protein EYF80_030625 [Liparis tanakae]
MRTEVASCLLQYSKQEVTLRQHAVASLVFEVTIPRNTVYIRDLVTPYTPARSLNSPTANRLVTPALR